MNARLCSCLMMSSYSVKFLLRTSSEISVIITGFFFSRLAVLGEGGRRGVTSSNSPVIYCCKKNSVTLGLRNCSPSLSEYTVFLVLIKKTYDLVYLISLAVEFVIILMGGGGGDGDDTNSRNTVPQLMVSQHLAAAVGEVIELSWWGASCWWKLCVLFFF